MTYIAQAVLIIQQYHGALSALVLLGDGTISRYCPLVIDRLPSPSWGTGKGMSIEDLHCGDRYVWPWELDICKVS